MKKENLEAGKEAIEFGEYLLNNHYARFKDDDDENKTRFWVSDRYSFGSKIPDNDFLVTDDVYKLFNPNWQAKQATPVKRDEARTAEDWQKIYDDLWKNNGSKSYRSGNLLHDFVKEVVRYKSTKTGLNRNESIENICVSFGAWYSGMEKEKVERAYKRYLKESGIPATPAIDKSNEAELK